MSKKKIQVPSAKSNPRLAVAHLGQIISQNIMDLY